MAEKFLQIGQTLKNTIEFEPPRINYVAYVLRKLREAPDKVMLVDAPSGRQWTGKQLERAILVVAGQLKDKCGLRSGDTVSFHCRNSDWHVIGLMAVIALGGTYTGCGNMHPHREIVNTVVDSKASFMVAETQNLELVKQVQKDCPQVKIVLVDSGTVHGLNSIEHLYETGTDRSMDEVVLTIDSLDTLALIHFSSGTTGKPKPATRTHRNLNSLGLYSIASTRGKWYPCEEEDKVCCLNPLVHGGGFAMFAFAMDYGATAVMVPGFESPELFCEYVQKYKLTTVLAVPAMLIKLNGFKGTVNYDMSSLYDVIATGSRIDERISEEFVEKFKPKQYRLQMWWVSLHATTCCRNERDYKSNGIPSPGVEMKIIDPETLDVLGPNKSGEILVKSPLVTPGYLDNPEANAINFDSEGFFRTGDCGYYDSRGRLYIVDRFKEIIKFEGVLVTPTELESLLRSHHAVLESAVIGVPHEVHSEVPMAFVVTKDGVTVSEKELLDFVNAQVASFKQIRGGIRFLKFMPLLAFGKVDRRAIRQMAQEKCN